MFLKGPFSQFPYLDNGTRVARLAVAGTSSTSFVVMPTAAAFWHASGTATATFASGAASLWFASGAGAFSPAKSAGASTWLVAGAGAFMPKGAGAATWLASGSGTFAPISGVSARWSAAGLSSTFLVLTGGVNLVSSGTSIVRFGGSTAWDRMLSDDDAPIAYFAELEPWVLTDRS